MSRDWIGYEGETDNQVADELSIGIVTNEDNDKFAVRVGLRLGGRALVYYSRVFGDEASIMEATESIRDLWPIIFPRMICQKCGHAAHDGEHREEC